MTFGFQPEMKEEVEQHSRGALSMAAPKADTVSRSASRIAL
jgi:hypothetical protein